MSKTYLIAHKDIDGILKDRETAYPKLELEMHPIGTELPVSEQGKELHIKIGASRTILGEDAIQELYKFLEIHPSWSK